MKDTISSINNCCHTILQTFLNFIKPTKNRLDIDPIWVNWDGIEYFSSSIISLEWKERQTKIKIYDWHIMLLNSTFLLLRYIKHSIINTLKFIIERLCLSSGCVNDDFISIFREYTHVTNVYIKLRIARF